MFFHSYRTSYKTSSSDPVVIYKNGGYGLNYKNAQLMLKIDKRIKQMKALDDAEKKSFTK